ncbi:hypothetical protein AgCh_002526 [Apium graveolens]
MSAMSDTAGASFIPIIAAQLPRLLLADAPFWVGAGDNHRQAVKVFRLWVNRKIFPETWLEQYVNKLELFIKNSFPADIDTQERKMDGMHFEESGRNIALQCFNTETTILSLTGSEHLPKRISGPLQPPWRQLHNNVSFQPVGVSQRPLVPSKGFTTIASRPPTRQGHETAHDVVWTTGNFEWLFEACLIDDGKMCMICSADYNITVTASANSASAQLSMIPMLNGTNYVSWKENVEIVLGCMDLDLALRKEQPVPTMDDPKTDQIEKLERSNRMCLAIMKRKIPTGFRGSIAESTSAKKFLSEIEQYFAKNEKAKTSNLLSKLVTMKYKGKGNIREYIIGMSNLAEKLKELKLELSDELLVHLVLISLPPQFGHFVVSYNTQKEKWTLNELISHYVQEEGMVLQEETESAHLASSSHDKKRKRGKDIASGKPKHQLQEKQDKGTTCYFCKKAGHMKKKCSKYAAWRVKKGKTSAFVCSEVNLASVPKDTWWVDSGATTHISVYMQGFLWSRPPIDAERFIYVGNDNKVSVEAVGTFRLLLKTGIYLDLFETFVVPSFRRNFISISCLEKYGYTCSFGNNKVCFSLNHVTGSLIDNLYMLDTVTLNNESLHSSARGTKCKLTENSAMLWHNRLGHISKQRIQRLVNDRILDPLDLSDFQVFVECIKGKQTNSRKLGANRATSVLELIHTDISGPFPTASWKGQWYFITFIDDYSRYGYLFLIHEKSQALDVFKEYKAEVELQLNSSIKAVRSDRGGQYYGRYNGSGEQCPGPFANFLKECGIVPQYTMPRKPNMNGVAERRNRNLKDMVRTEARPYRPNEKKLDSRTDVDFGREDIGKSIVFEEDSHDPIYDSAESNDRIMIPIIVQGPPVQDNTEIPHEEPIEQTQQPHESQDVPLRRSTRERKSAIPDDYVVFLQKHEDGVGIGEDDPVKLQQAITTP